MHTECLKVFLLPQVSLDNARRRLRRANEGGGFLFLINARSPREKGKWIIESIGRLSGTQRKCELTAPESHAFGFTTPPGKRERKTGEKNRGREQGRSSSAPAHSQATPAVPRASALGSPVLCCL